MTTCGKAGSLTTPASSMASMCRKNSTGSVESFGTIPSRAQNPRGGRQPSADCTPSPAPLATRSTTLKRSEHSGAVPIGLYSRHAKSPHTSAALDVHIRYGDVGIEPLVSPADRHSEALELAGIVSDVERCCGAHDGIFSV